MGAGAGGVYLQFTGYTKPAVSFLGIPCATMWVPSLNILAGSVVLQASTRRNSPDSYLMTVAMYSSIAAVIPAALELVLGFMATIEEHEYQIPLEGVSPYALLTAAAVEVFGLLLLILTIVAAILCHRILVRHRVNKYLLGTKWAQCKDRPDEDDIGVDHSPRPPPRSVCFVVPIPDHALQKFEANGFTSAYPYDWVSAEDDVRNKPLVESPKPQRQPGEQQQQTCAVGRGDGSCGPARPAESAQKAPEGRRVRRSATTNKKQHRDNRRKPAVKSMRNAWEI
ncbi:hypothetical protein Bbelb_360750 [Branchiostoma belcheri]|nr:hypothetical protein Bbelb_360750 [Branchiostoma belcheri]